MLRDKNTEFYYQSAKSLYLPVEWMDEIDGFTMKLGRERYFFCVRDVAFNRQSNSGMASNKYNTNQYLRANGFPVPKMTYANKAGLEAGLLKECIAPLKFPLVIKPTFGGLGKNVICNIKDLETLEEEAAKLLEKTEFVNIEEFHGGLKSYRALLFKKKVIALVFREGAHVFGDGQHSIQQLIEQANRQRAEIGSYLKPIVVDVEARICLKDQGLGLDDVPARDQKVILCHTSNASRGGVFEALPLHKICPENRQLLERIARVTDMDLVGIDVECENISIPIERSRGVILELNSSPSIRIHEEPMAGPATMVTRKMMKSFIFKHPFAYLKALYYNRQTSTMMKAVMLLAAAVLLFVFLV